MEAIVDHAQASTRFSLLLSHHFCSDRWSIGRRWAVRCAFDRSATAGFRDRHARGFGIGARQYIPRCDRPGSRLCALGLATGLTAAIILTRVLSTMLIGVKPTDPAIFVSMIIVFFAISALASYPACSARSWTRSHGSLAPGVRPLAYCMGFLFLIPL
jgi:hypothetical protein